MNKLHVEITGKGPPLVLLHGWAMHGGIFAPLTEALRERRTLYVVDLPGHGHSRDCTGSLQPQACAEAILDVLPDAPWCGWSLGGLIAQQAALLAPQRVPVVARVQGSAFGGGAGLVACCDIVVAVSDALFCFSEVKLGLVPAVISPYVIRAIGPRAARRYFITAERFNAGRAQRLGLVHKVVEHHELDATVAGLVEPLLLNGPQAMHAAKQLVAEVTDRRIDSELIALTASRIADVRSSAEGKEGVTAFVEKRRPNWL